MQGKARVPRSRAIVSRWSRADYTTSASGVIEIKGLNGNPNGLFWCPGESDFPLRLNSSFQGGWFWHKDQDNKIRSLEELMDKYTKSVGRNTNMLLGIVVDDRGLVPDADVKRMNEFGKEVEESFLKILAKTSGTGNLFELKLNSAQNINFVVIQENISKGEQIRKYEITGKTDGIWKSVAQGQSVGHKRIEKVNGRFDALKLEISEDEGTVNIINFACHGAN